MGSSENTPLPSAFALPFRPFGALLLLVFIFTLLLSEVSHYYRHSHATYTDAHNVAQFTSPKFASLPPADLVHGREDLAEILIAAADFFDILSAKHHLHSLSGLSNDLRIHASEAEKSSLVESASTYLGKRSLLDGLARLFGGGGGSTGAGASSSITSALGGLLDGTVDSLAGPAQYLGDGLGRGAAMGLKLNTNAVTAQTSAQKPTGINAIADNLGFGLANSLAGSVNLSSLTPNTQTIADAGGALAMGLGGGAASGLKLNKSAIVTPNMTGASLIANDFGSGLSQSFLGGVDLSNLTAGMNVNSTQVSAVVSAAGKGLGSGAAEGLKLPANPGTAPTAAKKRQAASTSSSLDLNTIAEDFTQSLSSSFLSSVDLKSLLTQATSGMGGNSSGGLTGMIGSSLAAAGTGLGSGAAVGLGLQQDQAMAAAPASTDVPGIAKDFTFQLATSFLQNGTLSSLQKSITSSGTGNIMAVLGPAAQGAGSGIGQGVAVGLGLQGADTAPAPMGGDVAMVARGFTFGLTDGFLANGTVLKLATIAKSLAGNSSSLNLQSVRVAKAAEGLARGLVDGAGESINNAGGFQSILDGGNATAIMASSSPTTSLANSSVFNDTVGGAAISFGRGLGGEAVALVLQAFNPSAAPTTPSSLASTNTPMVAARSLAHRSLRSSRLIKRASLDLAGIFVGANITAIDTVLDKGIDAFTCQGIGGFVSIGLGLISSKTINSTSTSDLNTTLPNATFTIHSDGNRFDINLGTKDISVNGNSAIKLAILIVFHAFLLILAYFVAIPIALFFRHGRAIAVMIGRPEIWANAPKWNMIIWGTVVIPFSLIGFILGVLILGDAKQFISPHGILGLIAFLLTLVAGLFELPMLSAIPKIGLLRGTNLGILLILTELLFITGFADISKVSLCITNAVIPGVAFLVIGGAAMLSLMSGLSVVAMRFLIQRWVGKKRETPFWGADEKVEIMSGAIGIKS